MGVKESIKGAVPQRRQRQLIDARVAMRRRLDSKRPLPDLLILGAQRAGTSSLYKWLEQHPNVGASLRKETEYLTTRYDRGLGWYRAHFPSRLRHAAQRAIGRPMLTFEASPYYLHHPLAAARAAALLPDARLVVLVRDPIERAFSQHQHMVRLTFEPLSFADAVAAEPERLADERERVATDPTYVSRPHQRFSYLERSTYAPQLERWLAHYPREQLLVLCSEDLYANPADAYRRVLDHVGLPPFTPGAFANHSRPRPPSQDEITPAVRAQLEAHFAPHNAALQELVGETFAWGPPVGAP